MEVSLVTELYPGAEYRGDLPVYKVTTDTKDGINVYVGFMTGDISSIRSDSWRIWDFLWSLHIMDYRERDNINNILLQILSVLALVTSMSGITLFFVRSNFKESYLQLFPMLLGREERPYCLFLQHVLKLLFHL